MSHRATGERIEGTPCVRARADDQKKILKIRFTHVTPAGFSTKAYRRVLLNSQIQFFVQLVRDRYRDGGRFVCVNAREKRTT